MGESIRHWWSRHRVPSANRLCAVATWGTVAADNVRPPPQPDYATLRRPVRSRDSGPRVVVRPGTASDWAACWAMDVSYETDHVWQLQTSVQADVSMVGFVQVRLPRTITLRDPLWGGSADPPQPKRGSLIVAEAGGGVDGFALVVPDAPRAVDTLWMLAVRQRARRGGLGARLARAAVEASRDSGRRALCATVQARNYPAIRTLQAAGFVLTGYDEQYYPSNDVGLRFAHRLAANGAGRRPGNRSPGSR